MIISKILNLQFSGFFDKLNLISEKIMATLAEILAQKKVEDDVIAIESSDLCPIEIILAFYSSSARNIYLVEDYEIWKLLHTWLAPFSFERYKEAKGIKFLDLPSTRGLSYLTAVPEPAIQEAIFEIESLRLERKKNVN